KRTNPRLGGFVLAEFPPSFLVYGAWASVTSRLSPALRPLDPLRPLTLAVTAVLCLSCCSCVTRQQRRRLLALEPPLHRLAQEAVGRPALLAAGGDHRPHPLTEAPAALASRPLGDVPVDHHEADRLLRQVIRRLDPRRSHEREVRRPVFREPLLHVLAMPRRRAGKPDAQHPVPGRL